MTWRPALGAIPSADGTRFRVWSTSGRTLDVEVESKGIRTPLESREHRVFEARVPGVGAGDHYRLWLDGRGPFPDPASRFQPRGVHGPSEVVDPTRFAWTDRAWHGLSIRDTVLYEIHVGAFTPEGTFRAAAARLPELRDLGVTAIELMPLADFPGDRNWGYDGAALFAPARCYGMPDDLRRLVDDAHRLGLAVHLDVVYNHLGPDGAYLAAFSPRVLTKRHTTPWGDGINLDGPYSKGTRAFFIESALHWVHEYHLDGLRVDATHAMVDKGSRHFAAELAATVRESIQDRQLVIASEDGRNLAHIVKPEPQGGWGMDAMWADDTHHQVRRLLTGDRDGYFAHYTGSVEDLAITLRQGMFFTGQGGPGWTRGTDPAGLPPERFIIYLQNHDQIGNRALGGRLSDDIDLATYRVITAVLLLAPHTPLLFMGQEWAASAPFQYFTDHGPKIGPTVTEGRRREFAHFDGYADPVARESIPDPQAPATFERCRLDWSEREREPYASILRLYRELLRLRTTEPALAGGTHEFEALDAGTLLMRRENESGAVLLVARLTGSGDVDFPVSSDETQWSELLSTESPTFTDDPCPVGVRLEEDRHRVRFERPGAIVMRRRAI